MGLISYWNYCRTLMFMRIQRYLKFFCIPYTQDFQKGQGELKQKDTHTQWTMLSGAREIPPYAVTYLNVHFMVKRNTDDYMRKWWAE